MVRLASLALLVAFTLPAAAQTGATGTDAAPSPPVEATTAGLSTVDADIVGAWTLAQVEDAGPFERFDAEIAAMAFTFSADGGATAVATIAQDGEQYVRESTFTFGCSDGAIVSDDHPTIRYVLMDDGRLRLTDASGLTVHMTRDAGDAAQ